MDIYTFRDFCDMMIEHNKRNRDKVYDKESNLIGVIVTAPIDDNDKRSLEERSYAVLSGNKAFIPWEVGTSMHGVALEGDDTVYDLSKRLHLLTGVPNDMWMEYCYFIKAD